MKDAVADYRQRQAQNRPLLYSVSVWGMEPGENEKRESLVQRLCGYVSSKRKAPRAAFVSLAALTGAGFDVQESTEPKHHYDVVIQDPTDELEIARLAAVFSNTEERRFPACLPSTS